VIWSLGGKWQVLSLRRKGIKIALDERILGEDKFIRRPMSEAEKREKGTLMLGREVPDLLMLAERVVREEWGEGVEEWELCSGIRKRGVVKARRVFCQLAIRRMDYPGAEVARLLSGSHIHIFFNHCKA
jgi:hypothetical protein